MKAMRKRFLAASLGLAAVSLIASDASATRFTETAEFWVSNTTFGSAPPTALIELQGVSAQGGLFTNTFAVTSPTTAVIHTVGANFVTGGSIPGDFSIGIGSPINTGGPNADTLMVIYALVGDATSAGPSAGADFTKGRAIVLSFDPGTAAAPTLFNDQDPSTWQFTGLGASNVLAIYDLAPKEDVFKGANGDLIGNPPVAAIPAANTNFSNINVQTEVLGQGILLFDFAGNGAGLPTPPNGEFQENLPILTGLIDTEGLVVFSENTNISDTALSVSGEAMLNSIFSDLIPGEVFSSNADAFTTYNPAMLGDFYNEVSINANPSSSINAIPEPASMLLGAMGLMGLALRGRRSRA